MFGAQLNIKAKEYSLLVVQVLHHLLQYFGSYELMIKLQQQTTKTEKI
jgi:hypothetical protein